MSKASRLVRGRGVRGKEQDDWEEEDPSEWQSGEEKEAPHASRSRAAGERKWQPDTSRWRSKRQRWAIALITLLSQGVPARERERRSGRLQRVTERTFEGSCWAPDRSRVHRPWQKQEEILRSNYPEPSLTCFSHMSVSKEREKLQRDS